MGEQFRPMGNIYQVCQRPTNARIVLFYASSIRGHISIHLDSHYRALSGRLKYLPSETFTSWPILMIALDTRCVRARARACVSVLVAICLIMQRPLNELHGVMASHRLP